MSDYIATPRLRWTLKRQSQGFYSSPARVDALRGDGSFYVLEQWWQHPGPLVRDGKEISVGKWRDVSLEVEGD